MPFLGSAKFIWHLVLLPMSVGLCWVPCHNASLHPGIILPFQAADPCSHLELSQTAKKKMTASSIYFQSLPYALDPSTQLIDYEGLAKQAKIFKPRLIICGASAYPRDWDYATLRKIADEHGAYLMADIAHISGLVAAGEQANPFEFCDVVTTTTLVSQLCHPMFVLNVSQTQDTSWSSCGFDFLQEKRG